MTEIGKLPPQAIEIEKAVLGAILLEKDLLLEVLDILTEESFYIENHKTIFRSILELNNMSENIDILTVAQHLKKTNSLNDNLSPYVITQLTNSASSSTNIESHSMILKQMEIRRSGISIGSKLIRDGYNDTVDATDLMDYVLDAAYEMNSFTNGNRLKSNSELISEDKNQIEHANTHKGITGKQTGIESIDRLFGGYQDTDLIIKAARPGMGKTSQMICEAMNMVVNHNLSVAIFSIEMDSRQLMRKLIVADAEIDLEQMKEGNMTQDDWSRYNNSASKFIDSGLIIDDKTFTLNGIRKASKKLSAKGKLDIIFIDYLQLIVHNVAKGRSKENEVSEISKSLKRLAKELNVPIVCLSQLSRAVETRGGDKRPQLSDLRDSGSIEQDADIVQFLYRPEYYGLTEDADGNTTDGLALMIVAKHRGGVLKDLKMRFVGKYTKFENWSQQPFSPLNHEVSPKIEPNNNFDDDVPF